MNTSDNKKKILVIDDALIECELIKGLLEDEYNVITTCNAVQGISLAEKEQPNLILLDVKMPEINGYEVCKKLKNLEKTSSIPVIFLTIIDGDEDETKGLVLGAVDFINKSASPAILRKRIRNQLELQDKHQNLKILNKQLLQEIEERKQSQEKQKLLEAKIRKIQKLESLGTMAGGIAHDFNNLLTPILGYADLACLQSSPESAILSYIKEMRKSACKAAKLTEQILLFAGSSKNSAIVSDLSKLVSEVKDYVKNSIPREITLEYNLTDNVPRVRIDHKQLKHALMNLITNGVEAIGPGPGKIICRTGRMNITEQYLKESFSIDDTATGLYSYIEVQDTGDGMDNTIKSMAFEPFYTTKFQGRGLGLSAVLEIVCRHQGIVSLANSKDKGTTVRLLFPAVSKNPGQKESNHLHSITSHHIPKKTQNQKSILVIEDEKAIRNFTENILTRNNYRVFTVSDGQQGVDFFKNQTEKIDLVLLDVVMPRLDGRETFIQIRKISKKIKIIFTSGYTEHQILPQVADLDPIGFIQKPYAMQTLIDIINKSLK
jgi:two-component system, cell cycle sensor histidine kinase and response regulator CckA